MKQPQSPNRQHLRTVKNESREFPRSAKAKVPIIGLGASAGGLAALKKFFSHMPPDSGFAIAVVAHRFGGHKSLLANLLARETRMNIQEVTTRITIKPNHVYVSPPGGLMTLHGNRLVVDKDLERLNRGSIFNRFLISFSRKGTETRGNRHCPIGQWN